MNTEAKFVMSVAVFAVVLTFWESERLLTAFLVGLGLFILLVQWGGNGGGRDT